MAKKIYHISVDGVAAKGRPPIVWEERVEQYLRERVGGGMVLKEAKNASSDREFGWRLLYHSHPLRWELPRGARRRR